MPTPTQRDIAKACGVSASTVSRALANQRCISAPERKRIQGKARTMGWRPNPLVSAHMAHLRSTRQSRYKATVAFVLPHKSSNRIADLPHYTQLAFEGARKQAVSLGYKLEPIWLHEVGFSGERLSDLLRNRGIPGAIFYGGMDQPEAYDTFRWDEFAVAAWGVNLLSHPLHVASCHYPHIIPKAVKRIRDYGYRRLAMILTVQQDFLSDYGYFSAFYHLEHRHREDEWVRSLTVPSWDFTPENSGNIRRWIETNRPEVIIGEKIVWETLEHMGWKVPDDVAFVSPFWSCTWPHVAGVDHRPEVVGEGAFDLVSNQLMRNERGIPDVPKFLLHEGRWVEGDSLPRKTKA